MGVATRFLLLDLEDLILPVARLLLFPVARNRVAPVADLPWVFTPAW